MPNLKELVIIGDGFATAVIAAELFSNRKHSLFKTPSLALYYSWDES
jgi:hypothetical protein